jgi:SAM-dependent methyltransferase
MPEVDLYNGYYDQFSTDVLGAVRRETYGEDLGQSSWMTADELRHFISLLELKKSDSFLEVASGSGGCSLFIAEQVGCHVIGIDINEFGIKNSNELARKRNLDSIARFQLTDAGQALPFEDNRFNAIFSNDAICHIPGRAQMLKECHRLLKPGGRMLFTDALVVTGLTSHEEIARRSSIGYYEYSPPGVNERLIQDCKFELIQTEDLTTQAALISERWLAARERHRDALLKLEGESKFNGLQDFLKCVHTLSSEKRLARFMYLAKKV